MNDKITETVVTVFAVQDVTYSGTYKTAMYSCFLLKTGSIYVASAVTDYV